MTNSKSSLLWISMYYLTSKAIILIILICLLEFILWKRLMNEWMNEWMNGCKDVSIMSLHGWTVKTDKFTLFVYCNFLVLLRTTVCSKNINKQTVNIADKNLTNNCFLSRHHYTKSKNYLKRRYRITHWIPMFIGTPCMRNINLFGCMIKVKTFLFFSKGF